MRNLDRLGCHGEIYEWQERNILYWLTKWRRSVLSHKCLLFKPSHRNWSSHISFTNNPEACLRERWKGWLWKAAEEHGATAPLLRTIWFPKRYLMLTKSSRKQSTRKKEKRHQYVYRSSCVCWQVATLTTRCQQEVVSTALLLGCKTLCKRDKHSSPKQHDLIEDIYEIYSVCFKTNEIVPKTLLIPSFFS